MRRGGLTIAELLVWMVLSFLVIGLGTVLLWQILRTTSRGTGRAQLQQTASTSMNRIISEVQRTTVKGITLAYELDWNGAPYNCAAIQLRVGIDAKARSSYADHRGLIFYCWTPGTPVLRRRVWPGLPPAGVTVNPTDPERFTDDQLKLLLADLQSLEARTPDVTAFRVYSPDVEDPNLGARVQLTLQTRREAVGHMPPEFFTLERIVVLRNSL